MKTFVDQKKKWSVGNPRKSLQYCQLPAKTSHYISSNISKFFFFTLFPPKINEFIPLFFAEPFKMIFRTPAGKRRCILRSALFSSFTQLWSIFCCGRSGSPYRPHIQGPRIPVKKHGNAYVSSFIRDRERKPKCSRHWTSNMGPTRCTETSPTTSLRFMTSHKCADVSNTEAEVLNQACSGLYSDSLQLANTVAKIF